MKKTQIISTVVALFVCVGLASDAYAGNWKNKRWQPSFQFADWISMEDGSALLSSARLHRSKWMIEADFSFSNLEPNSGYTIWWGIFNKPENCQTTPCGAADLFNPDTKTSMFYATGFVTGEGGSANISTSLVPGELPEGIDTLDLGTGVPPMLMWGKTFSSEVQVVLRHHGELKPGDVDLQTSVHTSFPDCCSDKAVAVFEAVE